MPTEPTTERARGINVSHYDGEVDWGSVLKSGISFAFVKATDGITDTDPTFTTHWKGIGAVGLTRGAYHYLRAGDDPTAQAEHFLKTVPYTATDLPPVLDIESSGNTEVAPAALVHCAAVWLEYVAKQTGRKPILYTYPSFWEGLPNTQGFAQFPLWIAEYTSRPSPTVPSPWKQWTFWQYASPDPGSPQVRVPGVQGLVDADYFQGSHAELTAFFKL